MDVPQCSSISSEVDAKCLMQVQNGISKKDPSNKEAITFAFFVNQALQGKVQV